MSTKSYVLDSADHWGTIPSFHLDRGEFFSTPHPSEEGMFIDPEYDMLNFWDIGGDTFEKSDLNHNNFDLASESPVGIKQQQVSHDPHIEGITLIKQEDIEFAVEHLDTKDEGNNLFNEEMKGSSTVKGGKYPAMIVNSRKGRRYTEEFKREVFCYLKSHSVQEASKFFDIPKVAAQRWKSLKVDSNSKSSESMKKTRSQILKAEIMKEKREEILKYLESHTYNETHLTFGISLSCLQTWKVKRHFSEAMSKAVLGSLVDQVISTSSGPPSGSRPKTETETPTPSVEHFEKGRDESKDERKVSERRRHYSVKEKRNILEFLESHSLAETVQCFQVSKPSLYRWCRESGQSLSNTAIEK